MAKSSFENAIPIKGMTANEKNALADSILKQISSNKKNVEETVDVQFKVNTVLDINGAKVDITKKYSDLRNTILEEQKKTQKIINKKRKSTGSGYSKMAVTEDMEGRASRITTEALRNGLKRSDEDSFNKILLTREKIIKKLNDLESERSEISKQSFSSAKADAILENLQKQLALRQKLRDVEETKKYQGFMPQSGITADDKIFNQKILDERKKLSSEAFDFYNKNLEELDKKTNTFIDKVKQSGNINEEYIDSDAYVRKFQEAEESSRQLISSIQESSKSTTNYIEKYGKDVLQLAKNIDTIYNNAMSNHGNLSDIDPRTLKKMAEMYSVLDHITDGKWMDMEIDSDLLYSLDEVSNFLYEESQNSGSSVEKIINAVTVALTKMGSAAKVALPALEGVSSEVTGTKSVSNTDLYDKMIGWSNEERLLYKKGTPSNERFAFANLDTGYMGKIGISDKLHGVSGSLIDAAFKQAEETVNAFVHSHTDVGPAAFSIRDIENAFDSLSDGINYQILKSIDEIAIFDASKIDASKQDSILKDMKSIFSGKLGDALDDNRKYGMLFTELGDSLNQELTNAINSALQKSLNIEGYSNIKSRFSDQIRNNIISDIATSIMSNGPDVAVPDPSMIQDSIFNIFEKYRNELKSLSNEASFGNEIDRFFEDFQLDLADNFIELWDKVPANKYFSNDYYNSIIQESLIESLKKNGYETNWKDVYKIMPIEQFVASKPQQETGINGTQGSEERAAAVRKEASAHRENAQAITEEEEARAELNEIIASNNEDTSAPILAEAEAHQANADAMSEEQKARDSLDDDGGQTSSLPADSVPVESDPVISDPETQDMERLADAVETVTRSINKKTEAFEDEKNRVHDAIKSEIEDLNDLKLAVEGIRDVIDEIDSEKFKSPSSNSFSNEKSENPDFSSDVEEAYRIQDAIKTIQDEYADWGILLSSSNDTHPLFEETGKEIDTLIKSLTSGKISLDEFKDSLENIKSGIIDYDNQVQKENDRTYKINSALFSGKAQFDTIKNTDLTSTTTYFRDALSDAEKQMESYNQDLLSGKISVDEYTKSVTKLCDNLRSIPELPVALRGSQTSLGTSSIDEDLNYFEERNKAIEKNAAEEAAYIKKVSAINSARSRIQTLSGSEYYSGNSQDISFASKTIETTIDFLKNGKIDVEKFANDVELIFSNLERKVQNTKIDEKLSSIIDDENLKNHQNVIDELVESLEKLQDIVNSNSGLSKEDFDKSLAEVDSQYSTRIKEIEAAEKKAKAEAEAAQKKIDDAKSSTQTKLLRVTSSDKYKDKTSEIDNLKSKLADLDSQLESGKLSLSDYSTYVNSAISNFKQGISKAETIANLIKNSNKELDEFVGSKAAKSYDQTEIDKIKSSVSDLNTELESGKISAAEYRESFKKISSVWYKTGNETGTFIDINDTIVDIENKMKSLALAENGVIASSLKFDDQTKKLTYQVKDAAGNINNYTLAINGATNEINRYKKSSVQAVSVTKSFSDFIATNSKKVLSYVASFGSFYTVWNQFKQGINIIKEIDDQMTELKKVSDETAASYQNFQVQAAKAGREVAQTTSDMIGASADWKKMGYSLQESLELAKVSSIYRNVGDNISMDEATSDIVSTMKAFNLEASDSITIVDKINAVSNNFAVTSKDLGNILNHSSSSLAAANTSLDKTLALGTAMNEVLQDASISGSTLKVLSMRLRGAKTELEAAGESTDGMAESTSKLREQIKALTNVNGKGGFDIMKDDNTFKDIYDQLDGIADKWKEMDDISKAGLLELIAGKNRAQGASALLNNFGEAEKVLQTSLNAAGSATQENERYLDSISGKITQLKSQYQEFWQTSISSDAIKFWIDLATNVTRFATSIGGLIPVLGALSVALAGIKSADKQIRVRDNECVLLINAA